MSLSKAEQETIINLEGFSKLASVHTSEPVMIRKMDKLARENPELVETTDVGKHSKEYVLPRGWIRIAKPRTLNLTDEQRAARIERFQKGNLPQVTRDSDEQAHRG